VVVSEFQRPSRWSETWQRALGIWRPGALRTDTQPVSIVENVATSDLHVRGPMLALRWQRVAFAGVHNWLRIKPGYPSEGYQIRSMVASHSVIMLTGPGTGVANTGVPTIPLAFWPTLDGEARAFYGREFGWTDQPPPLLFDHGTSAPGGPGPVILEDPDPTAVVPYDGKSFAARWFNPPLGPFWGDLVLLVRPGNVAADISLLVELSMRGRMNQEGF
jgi:hypothetical protein